MWICALGDYCEAVHDEPLPLKPLVREALGEPVRRIGRFIQLALIGAGRCLGDTPVPPQTGVYTASGRGDLHVTLEVVEPLFRGGLAPKPLSFVNTVSNAPNFYIARHFGLAGRSNFVCSIGFAFESALELAATDMQLGHLDSALVGSVDVATTPVAEHRRRLQVAADVTVAEGSHWLWARTGARPVDALAQLVDVRQFEDQGLLIDWLKEQDLPPQACMVSAGQFLDRKVLAAIQERSGLKQTLELPALPGYYDSHSGAAIGDFLRQPRGEFFLHVNAETDGERLAIMLVRRL